MVNLKKIVNTLLNEQSIIGAVGSDNIFCGYPDTIQTFPCICFVEDNQSDTEFADNLPIANNCSITIHIYTKKLSGYMTSSEIGVIVGNILKLDYWTCTANNESPDVDNEVEHRILNYKKEFLS